MITIFKIANTWRTVVIYTIVIMEADKEKICDFVVYRSVINYVINYCTQLK